MNSASEASARAIAMRCRWPPENSCGYFQPSSACRPTRLRSSPTRGLDVALALDQVEGADRLGDDGVDPKPRVEARIGVLEDHLDAAAQQPARLHLFDGAHRDAVDDDFAGGRRQQPDHHAGHRGLARTGFADEGEGFALGDVEGHAVDGLEKFQMAAFEHPVQPRLRDVEDAAQIFDLDEGRRRHAALSLAAASNRWQATACVALPDRFRPLDPAAVESEGAARVEGAARRDRRKPRHRAGDLDQPRGIAR